MYIPRVGEQIVCDSPLSPPTASLTHFCCMTPKKATNPPLLKKKQPVQTDLQLALNLNTFGGGDI